ncbi:MAG: ParM/StbA family protein [Bacillota bacterium]|nr:ParM/StbA family protein [Bacillota bacterium]
MKGVNSMRIAIDLGYSHVKGVSENHRVLIPSVVSPARELLLADLGEKVGHRVEIRRVNGNTEAYFVGHLALREGLAPSLSLDRERWTQPHHDVLVLATARLLDAMPGTDLVVGLPPGYYGELKDALARHLMALHGEVAVDGGEPKRVSFGRVLVYPQGAGALLTVTDLPARGLVALVDVGYKTTDLVGGEIAGGRWRVISSLCGTVEVGVHAVHEFLAQEIRRVSGAQLDETRLAELMEEGGFCFRGREYDVRPLLARARANVAQAIADRVLARLGERGDFVRRIYLAGGGAAALPELAEMLPVCQPIPEAQWANALGYLMAGRRLQN